MVLLQSQPVRPTRLGVEGPGPSRLDCEAETCSSWMALLHRVERENSGLSRQSSTAEQQGCASSASQRRYGEIAPFDCGKAARLLVRFESESVSLVCHVLCSFAHGLSSALVVDIGASKTSVTPVENGFQVMMGHRRSGVAGDFLDTIAAANVPGCAPARAATASSASGADGSGPEWLDPLAPHTAAQRQAAERMALDAARRVREQLGSCGAPPLTEQGTFDTERPVAAPKAGLTEGGGTVPGSVRLGMGQELLVASEAAAAGALAVPKRPPGSSPLADLVVSSLVGLDDAVRTACGEAVLLTGGAACTAHCADRLSFELERLGAAAAVGVSFYLLPVPLDETFTSPWMGGSIVASAGTLPDLFLTAAEWKASGKDELHTRCP